jgi:hypothetical protein
MLANFEAKKITSIDCMPRSANPRALHTHMNHLGDWKRGQGASRQRRGTVAPGSLTPCAPLPRELAGSHRE